MDRLARIGTALVLVWLIGLLAVSAWVAAGASPGGTAGCFGCDQQPRVNR